MRPSEAPRKTDTFHRLHAGPAPLVLVNAWDAVSARLVERAGAQAIGTTSAGMAWSLATQAFAHGRFAAMGEGMLSVAEIDGLFSAMP